MDQYGMKMLYLPIPDKETYYRKNGEDSEEYLRTLMNDLEENGVPYLNVLEVFDSQESGVYFQDDTHINPRGHFILFEEVSKVLN